MFVPTQAPLALSPPIGGESESLRVLLAVLGLPNDDPKSALSELF